MNKIYLVGDTHGTALNINKVFEKHTVKNDVIVQLGDFGFIWNQDWKHKITGLQMVFEKFDSTLAFIDGNHENFEILNSFPVETWKGGKVHRISPNIIHLMRGQVFEIFGKTFFTMGGASSIDYIYRQNRISWWEEENITFQDMEEASKNLAAVKDTVDYVLTHTCAMMEKQRLGLKNMFDSHNENQLQHIRDIITFKQWYFGHYHMDWQGNDKFFCLWEAIVEIEGANV